MGGKAKPTKVISKSLELFLAVSSRILKCFASFSVQHTAREIAKKVRVVFGLGCSGRVASFNDS
jgi:hypothetical protein